MGQIGGGRKRKRIQLTDDEEADEVFVSHSKGKGEEGEGEEEEEEEEEEEVASALSAVLPPIHLSMTIHCRISTAYSVHSLPRHSAAFQ
jgi:hypothetical protein